MNNKGIKFLVAATVLALALAGTVAVVSDGDESYAVVNVAEISETGAEYATITAALADATTGQTVLVIANTSEAVSSSNSGNITLDMNGCTLTGTVTYSGTGTLTIKDTQTGGGITYSGSDKSNINNSGTMVINGVSITKTDGTQYLIKNTGTLTIEAGTFSHSTTGAYGSMICNVGSSSNAKANLTINGGTFTYGGNNALLKNDDFGVMDVNGGTFNVTDAAPNIICNWCEMTIDGGTFNYSLTNGGCIYFGAWETGSTLTINAGTFSSSGLYAYNGGFPRTYYQGNDGNPAVLEFGENFSMDAFTYDSGCYEVDNNALKVKPKLGEKVTSEFNINHGIIGGCTVTFMNGTAVYGTEIVPKGEVVSQPVSPTEEGYIFTGWYTDSKCTIKYDFSAPVTSSFSLYAGWSEDIKVWTVTFMNGELVYTTQLVEDGKMASKPNDPSKDGYRFTGWLVTAGGTAKFDFASKITKDTTVYAGWADTARISIPESETFTVKEGGVAVESKDVDPGYVFGFTVDVAEGYAIDKVTANGVVLEAPYSVTVNANVAIGVSVIKGTEKETVTEQTIENNDGSVTTASVTTSTDTVTNKAKIVEEATTTGVVGSIITTADVTASGVDIGTMNRVDEMVITPTMSDAIKGAIDGADPNSVTIGVTAEYADTVSLPRDLLHDANVKEISVTLNGATIVMPKTAVAEGEMADTISLSVTDAGQAPAAAIPEGASATEAFDLTLGGSNTSQFVGTVKVTLTMELPAGATNVKFLCVGGEGAGQSYDASAVTGESVSGDLPHFSTWTIIFTLPADIDVNVDDELPPIWQYVPQQQSSSSNTTMIVAACAAAVAAIAVALVMLNVVRKN